MERSKVNREVLRQIARAQVVTTQDLAQLLHASPASAKKVALQLKKRGLLKAVKRGEYASVPLDVDPAGFRPDPYLVVHKALGDRYAFSHYSALALLGAEQQVRRGIHAEAPGARARHRAVGGIPLHIHTARPLGWNTATTTVRRGGVSLRVTTPRQTLVDLALLSGPEQDYEAVLEAFRDLLPRVTPGDLSRPSLWGKNLAGRARLGHYLGRVIGELDGLGNFTPILANLRRSVASAGASYLGTRPNVVGNRFDAEFRVVYPGGV